jgi:RimJ/RimL family protein N-acetyltransferase
MNSYKVLSKQTFTEGDFSIVPIRFEDRLDIMKWRNEQIYHLRQAKHLSEEDQNAYFQNVVSKVFEQEQPNQLLFSFLKKDTCIGYGGLVHINWVDKHAEISFIMDTSLEKTQFTELWVTFLNLIEKIAFTELNFHKLFTYAFDIRKHLYPALVKANFQHEATFKEHARYEGKMIDVLIHSKFNKNPKLYLAKKEDVFITFDWANNEIVREHAFSKEKIEFEQHKNWFYQKIGSHHCNYYLLKLGCQPVGSARVDFNEDSSEGVISFLIDPEYHGQGIGSLILKLLETKLKDDGLKELELIALVKIENSASLKIFRKLNYLEQTQSETIKRFTKRI